LAGKPSIIADGAASAPLCRLTLAGGGLGRGVSTPAGPVLELPQLQIQKPT